MRKPFFTIATLTLCLAITWPTNSAIAQVKKWTDENGKVHYGDRPPETVKSEAVRTQVSTYDSTIEGTSVPEIVQLFVQENCAMCDIARQHMLDSDVPFTEYDIDKDSLAKRRYLRANGREVPLLFIGSRVMRQFSPGTFDQVYKRFRKLEPQQTPQQ